MFALPFSKLSKSLSDLLDKKFDFVNKLTVKSNSKDLQVENSIRATDRHTYEGNVKTTSKTQLGEIESNLNTDGATDASFKSTRLMEVAVVTAKVKQDLAPKLTVDVETNSVNSSLNVDLFSAKPTVDLSAVYQYTNFQVGAIGVFDAKENQISNYNVGLEYTQPNFTATFKTVDRREKLQFSFFHAYSKSSVVGARAEFNLTTRDPGPLVVAAEHTFNTSSVKGKVDTRGTLALAFEHKLPNPSMRLGLSAQWSLTKRTSVPDRFGAGIQIGDV